MTIKLVKTSELSRAALDWAVAKCEGHTVYLRHDFLKERAKYLNHDGSTIAWHLSQQTNDPIIGTLETGQTQYMPFYSNNWSQGGPIIEYEGIGLLFDSGSVCREPSWFATPDDQCVTESYEGEHFDPLFMVDEYAGMRGDTPLIAAMRCYVASKMGDEVEIPEELL